jgi:SAM-dependent methyltransferase
MRVLLDPLIGYARRFLWRIKVAQARFSGRAAAGSLPFDWKAIPYNRIGIISRLLETAPGRSYLEIGCDANTTFHSVPTIDKVGVDPAAGGTLRMTSDDFFAQNKATFDVIFIDGLHIYEQAKKDLDNALKVVNPGGVILLHDLLPVTWLEQEVPRINATWTGDIWKLAFEYSRREDLVFQLVTADRGVGIVRKRANPDPKFTDIDDPAKLDFAYLLEHYRELPLVDFETFWEQEAAAATEASS